MLVAEVPLARDKRIEEIGYKPEVRGLYINERLEARYLNTRKSNLNIKSID